MEHIIFLYVFFTGCIYTSWMWDKTDHFWLKFMSTCFGFVTVHILAVIALGIVIRAFYIMTAKREYWTTVANQNKRDGVVLKQQRGKILSCDGQLMSSTKAGNIEGRVESDFYGRRDTPLCAIGKPQTPSAEEVERNPRSRSAKLRIAERQLE